MFDNLESLLFCLLAKPAEYTSSDFLTSLLLPKDAADRTDFGWAWTFRTLDHCVHVV